MIAVSFASNRTDIPDGWPIRTRVIESEIELKSDELILTEAQIHERKAELALQMDAIKAAQAAAEPYTIDDLWLDRLSKSERRAVRAAARVEDEAGNDAADAIDIMRTGRMVWPHGNDTRERKNARDVRRVLVTLFGANRANQITARPT